MSEPVVHESEVPWQERPHGSFAPRSKALGWIAGNRALGCTLYEIPPGKRSFPYHWHTANEEAIYVLEGEATLRLAGREIPIRPGTYAAFPTGEEGAHQVVNRSAAPVRYLCFSTNGDPEIVVYADSGKIGVRSRAPGEGETPRFRLRKILAADAERDYFDGEE